MPSASYSYNPNIPQSSDNPADSQGQILTNFASIYSILTSDHFTFGSLTATDGQHQQVTLPVPLAGDPSTPSGAAAELYTKAISGIGQLFFINSSGVLPLTGIPLVTTTPSASGYGLSTPWGIVLNWGTIGVGSGGSTSPTALTFQVVFPTSCDAIILTSNNSNGSQGNATYSSKSTTGCNLYSASNNSVSFLAIGH